MVWDTCSEDVPAKAQCGHVRVPADPQRPELGTQKVGFELYTRRADGRAALGTLVAHEGGPGYPTTGSRDYYLDLYAPLMRRHDVLLVDERGTGTSGVIRCKPLQHGTLPYEEAVAACGRQLGERADTYGTAYAADDLALVLDALGRDQIDLYGDSYGTFFAQTFALRHPDRVRTLVLDASYPVSDQDPWYRDMNRAIRDALARVCDRDQTCADFGGDPVARLRAVAQATHDHPFTGPTHDAEGTAREATVDGVSLSLVTANATYGTSIYRELDAAVRAFDAGDEAPLLRLVAENVSDDPDNGNAIYYTAGEYAAVICNDYPQLWDVSLPPGQQREAQYRTALRSLRQDEPMVFDPFRDGRLGGQRVGRAPHVHRLAVADRPGPARGAGDDVPGRADTRALGRPRLGDLARGGPGRRRPVPERHVRVGAQRGARDGTGGQAGLRRRDRRRLHRLGWRGR